ncbi:MAG: hypothetical protein ACOCP8_09485 [archaeon]
MHSKTARNKALKKAKGEIINKYSRTSRERSYRFYKRLKKEMHEKIYKELYELTSFHIFSRLDPKLKNIRKSKTKNNLFTNPEDKRLCYLKNINEDNEIYKINSISELYNIDFIIKEDILNKIPTFDNSIEECGTESIAFYAPYHFYGDNFGIYIKSRQFLSLFKNIITKTSLNLKKAREFALDILLTHERFHYIVELYATILEHYTKKNIYENYNYKFYVKNFRTKDCIEETLANYFILQNNPYLNMGKFNFLHSFFDRQPEGYKQAKKLNIINKDKFYYRLEKQITWRKNLFKFSQIQRTIIPLPLAQFESVIGFKERKLTRKNLNIPIYILDNLSDDIEMRELLYMFFPNNIDITDDIPKDLKVIVNYSNTWRGEERIEVEYPNKYRRIKDKFITFITVKDYPYKKLPSFYLNKIWSKIKSENIFRLKENYYQQNLMDGTRWTLEIKANGRKKLIKGYGKIPDKIKGLLKLIDSIKDKLR